MLNPFTYPIMLTECRTPIVPKGVPCPDRPRDAGDAAKHTHKWCPAIQPTGSAHGPCTCTREAKTRARVDRPAFRARPKGETAEIAAVNSSADVRRRQVSRDCKARLGAAGTDWAAAKAWAQEQVMPGDEDRPRWMPADLAGIRLEVVDAYLAVLAATGV